MDMHVKKNISALTRQGEPDCDSSLHLFHVSVICGIMATGKCRIFDTRWFEATLLAEAKHVQGARMSPATEACMDKKLFSSN